MAYSITQEVMDKFNQFKVNVTINGNPAGVGVVINAGDEVRGVTDIGTKFQNGSQSKFFFFRNLETMVITWATDVSNYEAYYAFPPDNHEVVTAASFFINTTDDPSDTREPEPEPDPEPTADYTLTQTDINAFINNNAKLKINDVVAVVDDGINSGDTIAAVCDEGYLFSSAPSFGPSEYDPITGTYTTTTMVLADPPTTASYTFDGSVEPNGPFYVSTELAPEPEPKLPIPNHIINDDRFTTFINDIAATEGDSASIGDTIKLVSNGVWEFIESNSAGVSTSYIQGEYDFETGVTPLVNFQLGSTLNEVSLVVVESLTLDMTYYFSISMEQQAIDVSGTNNVYLVDNSIVKLVNKRRFVFDPSIGENGGTLDYGSNILSLIEIPSEISETLIGLDESIYLGSNNTGVTAKAILSDVLTFDMGEITTPANNGDLRDFDRTECVLHLPYSQSIAIEPEYVIGETIKIEYIIDVYSGRTTINIYSTKVEEVITTQISTLGINIPYSSEMGEDIAANNSNISIGGDNRFKKPFIEIVRNEALLIDGIFTIPILDEDAIINHTGFIKVEEIELEIDGSYSEKESVISALQNGVIIK